MLTRVICWIYGHSDMMRFDRGRMYLECSHCGRVTRGLTIEVKV